MRNHSTMLALMFAGLMQLVGLAADRSLEPGWSAVSVRVIEDVSGDPVVCARIQTTCKGSRYESHRATTDENGRATVPIYKTWAALRVTRTGFTNSTVTLGGTNAVTRFCTNAVIKMGRVSK